MLILRQPVQWQTSIKKALYNIYGRGQEEHKWGFKGEQIINHP